MCYPTVSRYSATTRTSPSAGVITRAWRDLLSGRRVTSSISPPAEILVTFQRLRVNAPVSGSALDASLTTTRRPSSEVGVGWLSAENDLKSPQAPLGMLGSIE